MDASRFSPTENGRPASPHQPSGQYEFGSPKLPMIAKPGLHYLDDSIPTRCCSRRAGPRFREPEWSAIPAPSAANSSPRPVPEVEECQGEENVPTPSCSVMIGPCSWSVRRKNRTSANHSERPCKTTGMPRKPNRMQRTHKNRTKKTRLKPQGCGTAGCRLENS